MRPEQFPCREMRLERFNIENLYPDTMLWRCEAKRSKAREIGAGGLARR
jgi:hypothetical protein